MSSPAHAQTAGPPGRPAASSPAPPEVAAAAPVIRDLRVDQLVDGVFACTRKERAIGRGGSPYLTVELSDATGRIAGRAFKDAEFLAGRFERGDIVRVSARVERFRDKLQLNLRAIARVESHDVPDPTVLLPTAYRDLDELDGFLEHLANEVYAPEYRRLLDAMLGDQALREQLRRAPCTRGGHHAYLGGLLEHTVAVATLAQSACELHRKLNSDLLLTAAIVHDIGKTREFEYGAEITVSEAGRLLGHVTLGVRLIGEWIMRAGGMPEHAELALTHCVLAHHGPRAGSAGAKQFASPEALALYQLNAVDAGVKGALEHGLP